MALLPLLPLLTAPAARAHEAGLLRRDRVVVTPDGMELIVEDLIPAGEDARALRRIFDRDRSGAIEAAEGDALGAALAGRATRFLSVQVDGRAVVLRRVEQTWDLGGGPDERLRVTVTLRGSAALSPGAHELRVSDRHPDRRRTVPLQIELRGLARTTALLPLPQLGPDSPVVFRVAPAPR